ncbi:SDR family oxidoreductase [Planctomicrobium piriforme]|uniref:SDR family oxidoreductase n=1 Tax=Planctomicrobium piriforme TaxID=1576369 RepID=UPI000AAC7155|nr:SDR family oxidoreductase [Planctomicrobium piriforme]
MPIQILIIGCGYLGLRAAHAWLERGHIVSALTRSSQRAAEWERIGIQPVVGDVLDPASLESLPTADVCLYAVGYDRTAPADKRSVYVDGLANVLAEIRPKIPRLIYISSTSVYGQDHGETVNEDSPCVPISEGGEICLAAEQLIRQATGADFRSCILRLAGIYGPQRLIARVEQLRAGTPLTGNPEAWLNLIHVDDAVSAVLRLAEQDSFGPLYLLSDASPLRRREFYAGIAELVGAPAPVFVAGGETGLNKRCDSTRIRHELNWELQYPDAVATLRTLF